MLTEFLKESIRAAYGAAPALLPGFRPRAGQRAMIATAARVLAGGGVGLIEAPTGTGKTLGYLLPGIVIAHALKKRLVVSTATVALQEQIAFQDYPVAARAALAAGAASSVALLKGRERYVCPVRLSARAANGDLFAPAGTERLRAMETAFESGAWDGDRDRWPGLIDEAEWREVNNQRGACAGRRCPAFRRCPHALALEAAAQATVVVASHDLALSSLARSSNSLFGRFEENLFVFDEGHALAARAISACAREARLDPRGPQEAAAALSRAGFGAAARFSRAAAQAAAAALGALEARFEEAAPGGMLRFPFGHLPRQIASLSGALLAPLSRLAEALSEALSAAREKEDALFAAPERIVFLGAAAQAVEQELEAWRSFFDGEDIAKWIEREGRHWRVHVSPFSASGLLEELLWKRARGALVTSATLSSCGSFGHTLAELGLAGRDDVECARLPSPFDWSRARIVVPEDAPDPGLEEPHTRAAAQAVEAALRENRGGVLALFCSGRQLERARALIDPALAPAVLAQGEAGAAELMRRHRERIDAGEPSAILGLASFFEGVDLPGRYLTLVILAKIPFPAPDEPLVAAAAESLEKQGLNPFARLHLPIAGRRMAQAAGRLMRREDDWGEIRILDRRLVERGYGRLLAASLPAPLTKGVPARSGGMRRPGISR